jgi:3-dehydroquinate dehydratase I
VKHRIMIETRGKKRDGDTPLVCTPLVGRTRDRVLAEAEKVLAKKPDLVEWRVDFFEAIADAAKVVATAEALREKAGRTPVIFTCRSARDGGHAVPIGPEQIVALHEAVCAKRLVEFVSFELSNTPTLIGHLRESTRAHDVRLILSYHNTSYTPGQDYLVERFLEAERQGADVAMVQVMPREVADVLTLLAATERADAKSHIPLISMSLGPLGAISRMVGGLFGSGLMFAVGESSSAPGQIPLGDLVTVYDIIRRSRGGEML